MSKAADYRVLDTADAHLSKVVKALFDVHTHQYVIALFQNLHFKSNVLFYHEGYDQQQNKNGSSGPYKFTWASTRLSIVDQSGGDAKVSLGGLGPLGTCCQTSQHKF